MALVLLYILAMSYQFDPSCWAPRKTKEQSVIILSDSPAAKNELVINPERYSNKDVRVFVHLICPSEDESRYEYRLNGELMTVSETIKDLPSLMDWVAGEIEEGRMNTAKGSKRPIVAVTAYHHYDGLDAAVKRWMSGRAGKCIRFMRTLENGEAEEVFDMPHTQSIVYMSACTKAVMFCGEEFKPTDLFPHARRGWGDWSLLKRSIEYALDAATNNYCVVGQLHGTADQ